MVTRAGCSRKRTSFSLKYAHDDELRRSSQRRALPGPQSLPVAPNIVKWPSCVGHRLFYLFLCRAFARFERLQPPDGYPFGRIVSGHGLLLGSGEASQHPGSDPLPWDGLFAKASACRLSVIRADRQLGALGTVCVTVPWSSSDPPDPVGGNSLPVGHGCSRHVSLRMCAAPNRRLPGLPEASAPVANSLDDQSGC
jgi:hypothetical protein